MNSSIKLLKDLKEEDKIEFGTKAVNLGKMIKSGINVPEGYCIGQSLFDEIGGSNESISFSDAILNDLRLVYDAFDQAPLAIRSSSPLEDSEYNSAAGMFKTFLNVTTFEDMVISIKKCIQFAGGEHVKMYFEKKHNPKSQIAMAVIIQKMINSRVSGVLFTANPMNNRYDQIIINCSWGLGNAVVDDAVEPDQWIIDKNTNEIIEEKIANKLYTTKMEDIGVSLEPIKDEMRLKASLDKSQVNYLAAVSQKIQHIFNKPQDIEWAYDGKDFFIVQSRSITTLYPVEKFILNSERLSMYLCYNTMIQGMSEPFTPLGYEFWRTTFAGYTSIFYNHKKKDLYPSWIKIINGRIYYDITDVIGKRLYVKSIPSGLIKKDPAGGKLLGEILARDGYLFNRQGGRFRISYGLIKWCIMLSRSGGVGKTDPEKAVKEAIGLGDKFIKDLRDRIIKAHSIKEKLRIIEEASEEMLTSSFSQAMYCAYALRTVDKHDKWIRKHYKDQFDLESIRRALPNNPTTTMGLELLKIARNLLEQKKNPNKSEPLIIEFLAKFGHRGDIEIDIGTMRWKDDPEYILTLIKSYMVEGRADEYIKNFEKNNQTAIATIEAIYQRVMKDRGKKKAQSIKADYLNFRTLAGLRERPKFDVLRAMDLLRDMMLALGRQFKEEGFLEQAEDIAFLTFKQILSDRTKFKEIIKDSKAKYNCQLQYKDIPRYIMSTGECFYNESNSKLNTTVLEENNHLDGTPISKGIHTGRIRVLYSPVDAKIKKGDIIVTHNTNPSWTPLFLNAGALIMESGGPLSHGAIVAREYGIPAVAGIPNAMNLLVDGCLATVNGEAGSVIYNSCI